MFCPNCGTQNPDAAQTCSKCNFHLKSAAAPKFKGTMLMMNPPGGIPGVPPPPLAPQGPGAATPPPPGAGRMPSKLKGTMVGVAPMGAGGAPPPIGASGMVPLSPPNAHAMGEAASAFSPPVPQPGVNPLGGTVAADAGVFGAFAAHANAQYPGAAGPGAAAGPAPYGAPQTPPGGTGPAAAPMYSAHGSAAIPPYGGPPPQRPGFPPFAHPPSPGPPLSPPYGGPPPQAPPHPYGQPQSPNYGQPMPMQPMGAPMMPYGQPPGAHMVGTLKSHGASPVAPTRRNPLLTLLLPAAVMFGGMILSIVLAFLVSPRLGVLGSLFVLGGGAWYLLLAVQMVNELKAVTHSEELAWWPLIVPLYQIYFMWFVVPQEVAKGKQMLGVNQAPQPVLLYIFLWHFALASDLNDMVR